MLEGSGEAVFLHDLQRAISKGVSEAQSIVQSILRLQQERGQEKCIPEPLPVLENEVASALRRWVCCLKLVVGPFCGWFICFRALLSLENFYHSRTCVFSATLTLKPEYLIHKGLDLIIIELFATDRSLPGKTRVSTHLYAHTHTGAPAHASTLHTKSTHKGVN